MLIKLILNTLKVVLAAIIIFMLGCIDVSTNNTDPPPDYTPARLTNSTWDMIPEPAAAGWSEDQLYEAYNYSNLLSGGAAVMVIVDDRVLYHWGDIEQKRPLNMVSGSMISALFGIHSGLGSVNLQNTLNDISFDDQPNPLTIEEQSATIQNLLQCRSGIYHLSALDSKSLLFPRPQRGIHKPGSYFYFNNWDLFALGTIFEQQTGEKIHDEFNTRIASVIGMEDFIPDDVDYVSTVYSSSPGIVFNMSCRDLARIGLLYLRKGVWNGTEVISENWIEESTSPHSITGASGGFGYFWWRAVEGRHFLFSVLPDSTFSSRGYGGQYIVVVPELDAVVVHTIDNSGGDIVEIQNFAWLLKLILIAKEY